MNLKAMKQALEALESYYGYMEPLTTVFGGPRVPAEQSTTGKVERAITSLRQAIAEAEKQDGYCQACDGDSCTAKRGCVALSNPPPQRQPLTKEQRIKIVKDNTIEGYHGDYFDAWGIIDDVEAAHGIEVEA